MLRTPVPETAINEHRSLRTWERDVDTNRPTIVNLDAVVLPESDPSPMKSRSKDDLGLRIRLSISPHDNGNCRATGIWILVGFRGDRRAGCQTLSR